MTRLGLRTPSHRQQCHITPPRQNESSLYIMLPSLVKKACMPFNTKFIKGTCNYGEVATLKSLPCPTLCSS